LFRFEACGTSTQLATRKFCCPTKKSSTAGIILSSSNDLFAIFQSRKSWGSSFYFVCAFNGIGVLVKR
jgi:hypothetical protein